MSLRQSIRFMREFARTAPASELIGDEHAPGPDVQSDADLDSYVRQVVETAYHPTSSCAMGTGSAAVVDPELRVRGLSGLRLADASTMQVREHGLGGEIPSSSKIIGPA